MMVWSGHDPRRVCSIDTGRHANGDRKHDGTDGQFQRGGKQGEEFIPDRGALLPANCPGPPAAQRRSNPGTARRSAGRNRIAAISATCRSGDTPRSPAISNTGSPGRTLIKENAAMVTPMKVGMISPMRRIRNASMRPRLRRALDLDLDLEDTAGIFEISDAGLLGDIHTVEPVTAQRIHHIARYLFRHRHEHH